MKLDDYEREVDRTTPELPFKSLIGMGAIGLGGEVGEVLEPIKKYLYQGHPLDREKVIEEIGDAFWYLTRLARSLGYTLDDVLERNVTKLRARYPQGFDPALSVKRGTFVDVPPIDGDWWVTEQKTEVVCPHCHETSSMQIEALGYDPKRDDGLQDQQHPGWSTMGWLLYQVCPECARSWYLIADTDAIKEWGMTLGGWYS